MEQTRDEDESDSSSSEGMSASEEQYDALIVTIRGILSENADSWFNNRKDSIRSKAAFYTDLADRLDKAVDELREVMDAIENDDVDVTEGRKLVREIADWW